MLLERAYHRPTFLITRSVAHCAARRSGFKVTPDDVTRLSRPIRRLLVVRPPTSSWAARLSRQSMARPTESLELPTEGPPCAESRLIGALAFFRHGARTPCRVLTAACSNLPQVEWTEEMVEDDPKTQAKLNFFTLQGEQIPNAFDIAHRGKSYSKSVFAGQLLRCGQRNHFRLGQLLRARYVDLFALVPPAFDRSKVQCRSTLFHRNLVSMRCLLAGLFPGDTVDVAVSTAPRDELCTHAEVYHRVGLSALEAEPTRREWSCLRQEIVELFGCPKNTPLLFEESLTAENMPLQLFRDELVCRMTQKLPIPDVSDETLRRIDNYCFELFLCEKVGLKSTREAFSRKAIAGPVIDLILGNLRDLEAGKNSTVLSLFLTHDDLLTVMIDALGVSDGYWPPFGASFVVELYRLPDGSATVQAYYRGKLVLREPWPAFQDRLEALALPSDLVPAFVDRHLSRPL